MYNRSMDKICRECKTQKTITLFGRKKQNRDGHLNICKVCELEEQRKFRRTKNGVVNQLFSNHKFLL